MSHLVPVGRIQLVPRFWVVLPVPEAENTKRFGAPNIKRGGRTKMTGDLLKTQYKRWKREMLAGSSGDKTR